MKNRIYSSKNILFIDKFITEEGFESTESYVLNQLLDNASWVKFSSLQYYLSLINQKWLVKGDIIRTSNKGIIDEHYRIYSDDGKLEGITNTPIYQGQKGIHLPKKILTRERISSGWSVTAETFKRKKLFENIQNF